MNDSSTANDSISVRSPKEIYGVAIPCLWLLALAAIGANLVVLVSFRRIRPSSILAADAAHPLTLRVTASLAACDVWLVALQATALLINSYLPTVYDVRHLTRSMHLDCCLRHTLEALRLGAILSAVYHLLALAAVHYAFTVGRATASVSQAMGNCLCGFMPLIWIMPSTALLAVLFVNYNETFGADRCHVFFASDFWRLTLLANVAGPLFLAVLVYAKILHFLKSLHDAVQTHGKWSKEWTEGSRRRPDQSTRRLQRRRSSAGRSFVRRRLRTVARLMLIMATFLMGWLPMAGWFALTCDSCPFPTAYLVQHVPVLFYTNAVVAQALNYLKALLNPFVYAYAVPDIRRAVRLTLGLPADSNDRGQPAIRSMSMATSAATYSTRKRSAPLPQKKITASTLLPDLRKSSCALVNGDSGLDVGPVTNATGDSPLATPQLPNIEII